MVANGTKLKKSRQVAILLACTADETKLWLSQYAKQCRNPCFGLPPVYQDLSMRYNWPVKNVLVLLPVNMKGNSKCTSGNNSLSPLESQNKDISRAA